MPAFFEYLRNITYYLLFMAVVAMVAPSGSYKKYIALVTGIILVGIVIEPIPLSRPSIPMTELFGNIIPPQMADEHFQSQFKQIEGAFHTQLSAQLESLLLQNGYRLINAEWETSLDFTYIRRVSLQAEVMTASPAPRPFIRVKPVRIAPYQPEEESDYAMQVKKLIAGFYNMSVDNIHVVLICVLS